VTLLQNFVAGAFRSSTADDQLPHHNPSDTDDLVASVPRGTDQDASAAVEAAAEALPGWRRAAGPARAEQLHRWAAAIEARHEEIAQNIAREVGKPIGEARGEVGRCVVILRYYAGEAVRASGEVVPAQGEGALQFTLREPLGVVALITPWNFPAAIPLWKAAPALALGNTVVLKPSEQASRTALLLAETAAAAGLPRGVFNVLLGTGAGVGEPLLRSEPVRGISFTGSTAVGSRVAAIAAERNVRVQTEMGGKNVAIVLPDADLDLAASLTASGAMRYAGQKCTATSRVIVHQAVQDTFLARLRTQIDALPVGLPGEPTTAIGPLINGGARDRVRAALAEASVRPLQGGLPPEDARLQRGHFLLPTLVHDVDPSCALAQEELFGPVLVSLPARDLEHALSLANQSRYGLSASLFTRDLGSALRYIQRIEAGMVRVNADTTGVDPHAPFGGVKSSSSGSREQGSAAREFYTSLKTVQVQP
jgi:alpha-ketoglutaric semialdehyde dehydrogenase